MTPNEIERIADAVSHLRPEWLRSQVVDLLREHHRNRTAREVMLALAWVAYDPDTRGPGRINSEGPWWHLTGTPAAGRRQVATNPVRSSADKTGAGVPTARPGRIGELLGPARSAVRAAQEKFRGPTS